MHILIRILYIDQSSRGFCSITTALIMKNIWFSTMTDFRWTTTSVVGVIYHLILPSPEFIQLLGVNQLQVCLPCSDTIDCAWGQTAWPKWPMVMWPCLGQGTCLLRNTIECNIFLWLNVYFKNVLVGAPPVLWIGFNSLKPKKWGPFAMQIKHFFLLKINKFMKNKICRTKLMVSMSC